MREAREIGRERAPETGESSPTPKKRPIGETLLLAEDLAVLLGVSPWPSASAHSVYGAKTGALGPVRPENEIEKLLRKAGEKIVIDTLAKRFGWSRKVWTDGAMKRATAVQRNAFEKWMGLEPLGLGVQHKLVKRELPEGGVRSTWETVVCQVHVPLSESALNLWKGGRVPEYARVYAEVAMRVLQAPRVMVGALLRDAVVTHGVTSDVALRERIVDTGARFYTDHIERRSPPPADATDGCMDLVDGMYAEDSAKGMLHASDVPGADTWANKWLDAEAKCGKLAELMGQCEGELKSLIKTSSGILGQDWMATWTTPESGNPSWKKIAEAIAASHGEAVPDAIVAAHRSAPSRRFRVSRRT